MHLPDERTSGGNAVFYCLSYRFSLKRYHYWYILRKKVLSFKNFHFAIEAWRGSSPLVDCAVASSLCFLCNVRVSKVSGSSFLKRSLTLEKVFRICLIKRKLGRKAVHFYFIIFYSFSFLYGSGSFESRYAFVA